MERRVTHIDVAKGISICLVAMYHSNISQYFPDITEPMRLFRIPLFFFLSGIFFSWNLSTKSFLLKKSESLLKPYFSVLSALFIVSLFYGSHDLSSQLSHIIYGTVVRWPPLWFLTHLFALHCFSYFLFRSLSIFKNGVPLSYLVLLSFLSIGSMCIGYFWLKDISIFSKTITLPGLPLSLDLILVTSPFFIFGSLIKDKVINFRPSVCLFLLASLGFALISQLTDAHVDFYNRKYDDPIYSTLAALCGIYIVVSISYALSGHYLLRKIPVMLGGSSLYIFIFHDFVGWKIYNYYSGGFTDERSLIYFSFVCYGLSIIIPLFIKYAVEHSDLLSLAFLPFKDNKSLQKIIYKIKLNI